MKLRRDFHWAWPFLWAIVLWTGCSADAEKAPASESKKQPAKTGFQIIELKPEQATQLKIDVQSIGQAAAGAEFVINGTVTPSHHASGVMSAPIAGRITRILAHEGEYVRKGQPVIEIQSLDFARLLGEYRQARQEVRYQSTKLANTKPLAERGTVPAIEATESEAETDRAKAHEWAVLAQLKSLGIGESQLEAWMRNPEKTPSLWVYAPLSGVVSTCSVSIGQAVQAYQDLSTLVGTGEVMIEGYVEPTLAGQLHAGDEALVQVPGYDQKIRATLLSVQASVDGERKSLVALFKSGTQDGFPKPGQQVHLTLNIAGSATLERVIPISAVSYDGDQHFVFVQKDAKTYELRPIEITAIREQDVVVKAGLKDGERIAVSEVFTLKTLARQSEFAEE